MVLLVLRSGVGSKCILSALCATPSPDLPPAPSSRLPARMRGPIQAPAIAGAGVQPGFNPLPGRGSGKG